MATAWKTFPVELTGGLITNTSPLQQGINLPGSARILRNFEPSNRGGYRRIEGFTKFDTAYVPPYGDPLVQGSGQTGTSLVVANLTASPVAGNTITVSGVTGTYTISVVSYSAANRVATLTLTTSLASSPADKANITFGNTTDIIKSVANFNGSVLAERNNSFYTSAATGWTNISVPSYGTVLVNGGSQTGSTLAVDGLTAVPQVGDTFKVNGTQKVYTVLSAVTVTSGGATISISPALASSPADNSVVTFLSSIRLNSNKHRFTRYDFLGINTILMVDGVNAPFKYDGTTYTALNSAPTEVHGADHVCEFKNHIFFAKGNILSFTAPYKDADFSSANGAGVISLQQNITGLIVFREQLIVFSQSKIARLVGNTIADFQMQPITSDIGCVQPDSIQELGGDIVFVGPDGIRMLSATDRVGDFGIAVASRTIQSEFLSLAESNTDFCSCVIREKNQYRLLGYKTEVTADAATGIIGVQFISQDSTSLSWAETRGIRAYVVDSEYSLLTNREVIVFAHTNGFVYRMESGSNFDGSNIIANFSTPFFSLEDPRMRKTIYKLATYIDPTSSVTGTATLKFDFDEPYVIQPASTPVQYNGVTVSYFGQATYGSSIFGGKLVKTYVNPVIGSGFTVSVQYNFDSSDQPFSLDAIMLEFMYQDRQ